MELTEEKKRNPLIKHEYNSTQAPYFPPDYEILKADILQVCSFPPFFLYFFFFPYFSFLYFTVFLFQPSFSRTAHVCFFSRRPTQPKKRRGIYPGIAGLCKSFFHRREFTKPYVTKNRKSGMCRSSETWLK